ncbi:MULTISPECIES: hypothetical protein [Pseudomonas]|uniref:hypothetical protein n=1 Tax=Pseudomonas TaxID=286 RepID=UPI000B898119|nr:MULTISPECIES: hypothetical protein [Pseudomonas]MDP9528813.1 hypothetical protein [Pseudomonas protegens]PYY84822.1 hypothetical protein DNK62_16400 [Pseudomonas sp. TKO30]PYY86730.1 hypothetical protein DNK61_16395 [Pseudomonas sp. TKO29]PYY89373.1 hypothetical protein DNK59_16400 [Pseudomonas sp. TKO26]PYY99202.1 hypothetical protein DNK60_16390 [Pseudomonas sp. TKO14]
MSSITSIEVVLGVASGLVVLGVFVWIGVCLHLAYTRMDEMLELLKNSSAIMNRAPLMHGGPFGKLLLVGRISGVVTFPKIYLKHGAVCIDDLNKIPARLKRKLAVLQWCVIWLLVGMLVCAAGIKLYGG